MSDRLILGIESSCDETGFGIVRLGPDGSLELLADEVASSVEEHARFGGVVPEVASRAHLEALVPTLRRALDTAKVELSQIHSIAVTAGPGLAYALLVGVSAAKAYAAALGKPFYGVNHLAGHVAADTLQHGPLPQRCLALLVSGGHSQLLLIEGGLANSITEIGSTVDDAVEARRTTRSRGCSTCRTPAARPSTSSPSRATAARSRSRAASPARATRSTTSRSPA